MLEKVDLSLKLSKDEYKGSTLELQNRLQRLQRACWKSQIATIIVFEGWDGAGKSAAINKLSERLEPRALRLHWIQAARTYETQMPWLWRFWQKVPNWGEICIFDRSWYKVKLFDHVDGGVPDLLWRQSLNDIVSLEQTLADDRYLFVKFFLHIDKATQKKRYKKLKSDPFNSWRLSTDFWQSAKKYDKYLVASEEMLGLTETEWAPWTIVEANDRRWARVRILDTVVKRLEEGLHHFKGQMV